MTPTQLENSQVAVEIRDLTKDYEVGFFKKRKVRALDHLTLQVRCGEIFGFLGPNGAGKTTTLKLLMRLIYPTEGTASILGQPIDRAATRARVGYLPENPYFYDYLTGRELLVYTAALYDIPNREATPRIDQLLDMVGLIDERADRQLRKYSKGMLQRIGIAQALVNDPAVVFLDEPMSGLDPVGRREVRDLILRLREQRKTVFFSSHILSDVEALCDRAAILSRGKLIRAGSVQEMTEEEEPALEILAVGLDAATVSRACEPLASVASVAATPNGVQLVLSDERDVDKAIRCIRESGGRLVSVNPRRRSLEDIFSSTEQEGK
jgi:ABC-2 type transport system ATP-binding protein